MDVDASAVAHGALAIAAHDSTVAVRASSAAAHPADSIGLIAI